MVRAKSIGLIVAVLALGVIGARSASACVVSSTASTVRLEGTTELLGTITLTCGVGGVGRTPTAVPNSSVQVILSGVSLSPASSTPNNTNSFPLPLISSNIPFTIPASVIVSGTTATFFSFTPIVVPQTITITGLRVNIASSGLATGTAIIATVAASGGVTLPGNATVVVANMQRGLGSGSGFLTAQAGIVAAIPTPPGAPASVASNPDPSPTAANSVPVTFVEGFATAFRTVFNEEGGAFGLQGTRLRIQLTGIPFGIIPHVPRIVRNTSSITTGTISPIFGFTAIRRVSGASADGSGGFVLPEVPNQFDQIPVLAGEATILYEVVTDDPTVAETITLYIALTVSGLTGVGTISGSVSLAPLGPPTLVPARPQFSANPASSLPPILSLSPTTLRFTAFLGSNPAPQSLSVQNAGGGVFNWTATIPSITEGNWLALSPASGQGNASVTVRVTSASLALGTYNAAITVSAAGVSAGPQTVAVLLTVVPRPTLVVTPSSLNFITNPGRDPASQQLTISAIDGALNWTATASTVSGGNWLSLTATSGPTPHAFLVAAKAAVLAAGVYLGTITVSAPDAANSPQIVNVILTVGAPGTPAIGLQPNSLVFSASSGRNPASQTFEVQNAGTGVLGWTATVATQSGGNWLSVSPTTAVAPSVLTVAVNLAGLAAGAYTGTITMAALPGLNASNSPQVLTVGLAVDVPAAAPDGVVNAASYSKETGVSPGSIASLFGTNLAKGTATATLLPLPTLLAGAQVLVDNIPAPLFYVSPTQINFQMPFGLSGSSAGVVVVSDGLRGLAASAKLAAAAPGLFTASASGAGQGLVLNQDFSLNSAANPAAGGSVIQIFATGLGNTFPPSTTGQPASTSPLSVTVSPPVVLIGGNPAEVLFSGLAPGLVGAYQINARVPPGTPAGNAVPLQVRIGGIISNTATVAIR